MTGTFTIESVYDQDLEMFEKERDRRPLTEKADPLALSWVAYRVWQKSPQRRWADWSDLEVHDHDREMAEATRRYYRNKLAMQTLRGSSEPTQFAQDLYDICNGGVMRHCHKGMLYRLPYFYKEDTRFAELQEHTQAQPDLDSLPVFLAGKSPRELERYGKIFRSRRSRETMEYWFHDRETGYAVQWSVNYENPLRSVVEHYFRTQDRPKITATFMLGHDRRSDFRYWIITQPELMFG
jgi:hypothetical protein